VASPQNIRWTNKSVLRLAGAEDPIAVIERRARELALRARDAGWSGPPFDPIMIADLLKIPVEANASVPDARIVSKDHRLIIQYNPTQPRARVRFTIAHEIAHTLFPDVAEEVRHRGGNRSSPDDWQLELLCNIAAAEFVMPLGSMPPTDKLPPIEELMFARKNFDVSAEAFLIRATRITSEPVIMFCASALSTKADTESPRYRVDYTTSSRTAPMLPMRGGLVPKGSAVHSCTAIGYTDRKSEDWFSHKGVRVECVGIPSYLGTMAPRVAGLIRFGKDHRRDPLKFVHGNVLDPKGPSKKIICQLVNDQARFWGGGVAKSTSRKFPEAQRKFSDWFATVPRSKRLGSVHFAEVTDSITIASLIGQEGFGVSTAPRIRYAALEQCFERVSRFDVSAFD
jgi:Zn-dependent peptidase ImmA (M78 family)